MAGGFKLNHNTIPHNNMAKKSSKQSAAQTTSHRPLRQGDVLLEYLGPQAEVPASAVKQDPSQSFILAHGEVTGHHHKLVAKDPTDWWKEGEIPATLDKPNQKALAGTIYAQVGKGGATVVHDTHASIPLKGGVYKITRQREYAPDAIRNVAD